MRVIKIIDGTTVDGPGFRTSIYFAGCHHQCPGCHNPTSWDMSAGEDMSIEDIIEHVEANDMNVTFSGGDPIYQLADLIALSRRIKRNGRNIWCYTGFTYEELSAMPAAQNLLEFVDVLVDGPYVESLRDTDLLFRGSSNQRLIDLRQTIASEGKVVLWHSEF